MPTREPLSSSSIGFDFFGTVISGGYIKAAGPSVTFGTANEPATIAFSAPVTSITITSTQRAFEFNTARPVPEPASLTVLGAGLLGLGLIRRRLM